MHIITQPILKLSNTKLISFFWARYLTRSFIHQHTVTFYLKLFTFESIYEKKRSEMYVSCGCSDSFMGFLLFLGNCFLVNYPSHIPVSEEKLHIAPSLSQFHPLTLTNTANITTPAQTLFLISIKYKSR